MRILIIIVLAIMLTAYSITSIGQTITLVENGNPNATLVTSSTPTPAAQLAALEIQYWIKKITGAKLDIKNDSESINGNMVLIGDNIFTAGLNLNGGNFTPTQYTIDIRSDKVILLGRDSQTTSGDAIQVDYNSLMNDDQGQTLVTIPGMFDQQGTLRAAYFFLQRYCGVRFYGPKTVSIVSPPQTNLIISEGQLVRSPKFKHSSGSLTWTWPLMSGLYGNPSNEEIKLFSRRVGIGGIPWYTNHTMSSYQTRFPRTIEPDIYPPEGSASTQLCYTSDRLAALVAQDAADYFNGNTVPYLTLPEDSDYFPVVPNDAGNYCTCGVCQAILSQDVGRAATHNGRVLFNNGQASNYWFQFVNKVAALVKVTHPDKYISTLAYEQYYWLPEFELETNISVAPCMTPRLHMLVETEANEITWYNEWVKLNKAGKIGPVFLWNYYGFPEESAVIRNWNCFPGFSAHPTAEIIKQYAADDISGIFLCGNGEQLDFYVIMQMMDDPTQDSITLINEFFTLYFGNAAQPMQQFYELIETTYFYNPEAYLGREEHQTVQFAWGVLGTEDIMGQLEGFITSAESLASTSETIARVAMWRTVYDYMVQGRDDYVEIMTVLKTTPPYSSLAMDFIKDVDVTACWDNDKSPYTLITGFQMVESTTGVLGTANALLDITNDEDRHWSAAGVDGAWVEFDLGKLYDLNEIIIWNYQQNRGYNLNHRGMRNVVITASPSLNISDWVTIYTGEIPIASDTSSFGPSRIVTLNGSYRYVKITSQGDIGIGNWGSDPTHNMVGLGQVRFYGKDPKANPPYNSLATNFINDIDVTASWDGDKNPYTLTTGFQMVESTTGVLGTADALLDITNDEDRHWSAGVNDAWVEFDLGKLYDLNEIIIWNDQQNRGYSLNNRGMRNVVITASPTLDSNDWVTIYTGEIPIANDASSFGSSRIITLDSTSYRYVRITAQGAVGVGNWGGNMTGLGQVRFYGKDPKANPPYNSLATNFINDIDVTASWDGDKNPYTLTTGFQMAESTTGVLGTANALLDITNDEDRHWSAVGADGVWVEFDLGRLFQLGEIRIWNYQQNRGYNLNSRGMRNVVITASPSLNISDWVTIYTGEIPIANDTSSFGPSKIVTLSGTSYRYVKITAQGAVGVGNWGGNMTGLGQVRFYKQ